MASNQKGNELIRDVGVAQLLTGLGVHAVQHGAEQVFSITGILSSSLHNGIGSVSQNGNVVVELFIGGTVQEVGGKAGSPVSSTAFCKEVTHGLDEGVHLVLVVRIETIIHRTQRNGVQRQLCEFIRYRNGLVRAVTSQFQGQL